MTAHAPREDYLIIHFGRKGEEETFMRSSTRESVQNWIDGHLGFNAEYEVRRVTLGERVEDVSDDFRPPVDDDYWPGADARAAASDRAYRLAKEGV